MHFEVLGKNKQVKKELWTGLMEGIATGGNGDYRDGE
jgi:hypothetical protein